jgi:hypothetical protein
VKTTEVPNTDGFGAEASVVVVPTVELVTTWVSVADELGAKLVGSVAVNTAKITSDPVASVVVAYVATPLPLTVSAGLKATDVVHEEAGDPATRTGAVHS